MQSCECLTFRSCRDFQALGVLGGEEGNAKALAELRDYLKLSTTQNRVVSERRAQVLHVVEAGLAEVTQVLDNAHADDALRNKALHPFQQLKLSIAGQGSIPQIAYFHISSPKSRRYWRGKNRMKPDPI